jgi:2-dehydro-3-deoxygluconokinase
MTWPLVVRPREECRYDLVALGEVMLRLDPGEGRIATTRTFHAWEGGGEYNVARGLRRCFGLRTAIVTALADNPVGRLVEDLMLQGGVEQAELVWRHYDGIGREARNGLNFTERGFGVRGAVGCSDRGHTAASQLRPGDVDWERIFGVEGVRWFHTGGVFCALSETTPGVALEAVAAARRHGAVVSYDLNYRPSLWRSRGGPVAAAEVNREIVRHVDVLFGNEEDFSAALGYPLEEADENLLDLDVGSYERLLGRVLDDQPQVALVASTLRRARTATLNDWGAACRTVDRFLVGPSFETLEILDRVGGGDSFASGLVYGLLEGLDVETALAYGVAHGALAMTTPGDTSMATLAEVERLVAGRAPRVDR